MKTRLIIILSILTSGIFPPNLRANGDVLQQSMNDTTRIRLLNDLAFKYFLQDEFDSCLHYASQAFNLSESILSSERVINNHELVNQIKVLKAKSIANIALGMIKSNSTLALDTLQVALLLMKDAGKKEEQGDIYSSIATVYDFHNKNEPAIKNLLLSIELYRETGNKKKLARALTHLAIAQRYFGKYGDALENLVESLKIIQQTNDSITMVETLLAMGFVYLFVEKWEDALKCQNDALLIYENMKDTLGIATVLNDMGVTNMEAGNLNTALKHHQAALEIRLKSTDYYYTFASYSYIGDIYEKLANYPEAIRNYENALKYAELEGNKSTIVEGNISCGFVYFKTAEFDEALKHFMDALELSLEIGDQKGEANASMNIARIYLSGNDFHKALYWLNKAEKAAPQSAFKFQTDIYESIADTYFKLGDYENAYKNLQFYSQLKDSSMVAENRVKITTLANRLEFENDQALQNEMHSKAMKIKQSELVRQKIFRNFILLGMLVMLAFAVIFFLRFIEKKKLNTKLNDTLANLKSTQSQLIHAEKMASLGELTAGIAHEIQNPLNFVNNFAEISAELIDEMKHELAIGSRQLAVEIAEDVKQNLEKINHHGKRADAIVKGMLQHSRTSAGQKELTDINLLADEYLRLAYHGLRAKDKDFNATLKTDFDASVGKINIIPQDIGRVILNLITNAFYAVEEKKKQLAEDLSAFSNLSGQNNYEPTVSVGTKKTGNNVLISVKDNGNGVPQKILDKIFQPFFTTKPTGQGTGLGLSLSYDIVKAHGGELKVETKESEGTIFIIQMPISE